MKTPASVRQEEWHALPDEWTVLPYDEFLDRRIIDTEGLVTPEAIHPKRMRRFVPFLESQRPDLLIIFPEWYPEIVARTDLFHEVYRIHAEQEAAAAPALVMFRTPWTRASVVPGLVQ